MPLPVLALDLDAEPCVSFGLWETPFNNNLLTILIQDGSSVGLLFDIRKLFYFLGLWYAVLDDHHSEYSS